MKLAFVGGGSYSWGPAVLGDLALSDTLSGTVCLMDIDPRAGERLQRLGQLYMDNRQAPFEVTYTRSLTEALEGADYVILSISTGGLAAMRGDLEIPETYGIYQAVGDTVGPGGIARGLRNIPVIVDLARQMERHCPAAWLINVTNPMTTLCRAVMKATAIKTIGLCHELHGVQHRARHLLGSDEGLTGWQVAGVNHFPWLVGVDGAALADFRERMAAVMPAPDPAGSPFEDRFRVKMDLLDLYGTFPAAGDRHVCEFFPTYLRTPAEAFDTYGVLLTRMHHREANLTRAVDAVLRQLNGQDPITLDHSGEQAIPIIESLSGLTDGEFVVNIPNQGQIHGLPHGVVVEGMASIDRDGVHPRVAPDLPTGVMAWVQTHVAAQELVVAAALERRLDLALQAVRLDPLCHRLSGAEARSMVQALDTHNARFAPALWQ